MGGRFVGLPHGSVSVANVRDDAVREVLRKLSENQMAIAKVLEQMKREERK